MKQKPPPKALRELWDQVPKMNCKQLCSECCGPIGCSAVEEKLIVARAGKPLKAEGPKLECTMLRNGLCSVYSIRPLVCRLWGTVPALRCPHGCEPERWLTNEDGLILMAKAEELSGEKGMLDAMLQQIAAAGAEGRKTVHEFISSGEKNRHVFMKGRK